MLKIQVVGQETSKLLEAVFAAPEYASVGTEWESGPLDADRNAEEIEAITLAASQFNARVFVETTIDDEEVTVELFPLSIYEKRGGEYDDAGNGGEVVEKDNFDLALAITQHSGFDEITIWEAIFPDHDFWNDSATSMFLRYKNDKKTANVKVMVYYECEPNDLVAFAQSIEEGRGRWFEQAAGEEEASWHYAVRPDMMQHFIDRAAEFNVTAERV